MAFSPSVLTGVGLLFRAVSDVLVDGNPAVAVTDALKALGYFGFGSHALVGNALKVSKGEALPELATQ